MSFTARIKIPRGRLNDILGPSNRSILDLCFITDTSVTFEPPDQLVINAETEELLEKATAEVKNHINFVIKPPRVSVFSHFVAVPTIGSQDFFHVCEGYMDKMINGMPTKERSKQSLFDNHFTLVLLILNDDQIPIACNIVKETVESFPYKFPDHIEIEGIHAFREKKGFPRIYYAKPRENDVLEQFKDMTHRLVLKFRKAGLFVVSETTEYHITLFRLNTIIVKYNETEEFRQELESADIQYLPLDSVALCIRYSPLGKFFDTNIIVLLPQ
jgi:2'-5' RNA ligase